MKKSSGSNENELSSNKKDAADNNSTASHFNSQKRSSKFDDITSTNDRPNSPHSVKSIKDLMKKIWKYIVFAIYFMLAALAITGLIQSCVLKTNSMVGSGIELYNSKNEVAPHVAIYKIEQKSEKVIDYDEQGKPKIDQNGNIIYKTRNYYVLVKHEKKNYLASKETISELKNNLSQDCKDLYGIYNNYSSSLRIEGLENLPINGESTALSLNGSIEASELLKGDNGQFIFMNNKILDYLNSNNMSYELKNIWEDINYFVVSRPENWNELSNGQKDYYGLGITDLSYAFQAFENIGTIDNPNWVKVEILNGEYVTKDANADGVIDSEEYIKITDQNRINNFKYSLNAEVVTLSKDNASFAHNSEKFARDYLQSMFNVLIKFPQLNDFYNVINKFYGTSINIDSNKTDIYSGLSKSNFSGLVSPRVINRTTGIDQRAIDVNKLFTLEQKNAIISYQNEITSLMTQLGFGVRQQVYSDEKSKYYVESPQPFVVEFQPTVSDKKNIILGTSSTPQKPIVSWADSWRLGPFYGLIVYPISFIINGLMSSMPTMNGWNGILAIILAILLTRVIVTIFTYKSLFASHKQQQLSPKKAKIDAKYAPFKGNREMEQRKRQELSKLYKNNNVSMTAPLKAMCIQLPIFFAVWRVVQGIPDIKATTWLGIQFSLTSWKELFDGSWQYLPLLIFAALTQLISQLLPKFLNRKRMGERANKAEIEALKKANKTQNIMMIVFVFISVIFEAGVQVYWIISGLWQIMQTFVVYHIVKSDWYRTKGYRYV